MRSLNTRWKDCRIRFWRANTSAPFQMRNVSRTRSKKPETFWNEEVVNEDSHDFASESFALSSPFFLSSTTISLTWLHAAAAADKAISIPVQITHAQNFDP